MSKSDYLETVVLNHFLRNIATTSPTTVYVALYTTLPNEDGTGGVEVTGGSYARQAVTFDAPIANQTTNSGDITFPTATADWGTVVGFALLDAVTVGNLLYLANLTAARVIQTNDVFIFPTGQIIVSED